MTSASSTEQWPYRDTRSLRFTAFGDLMGASRRVRTDMGEFLPSIVFSSAVLAGI